MLISCFPVPIQVVWTSDNPTRLKNYSQALRLKRTQSRLTKDCAKLPFYHLTKFLEPPHSDAIKHHVLANRIFTRPEKSRAKRIFIHQIDLMKWNSEPFYWTSIVERRISVWFLMSSRRPFIHAFFSPSESKSAEVMARQTSEGETSSLWRLTIMWLAKCD